VSGAEPEPRENNWKTCKQHSGGPGFVQQGFSATQHDSAQKCRTKTLRKLRSVRHYKWN
jgi:hypothetical protein